MSSTSPPKPPPCGPVRGFTAKGVKRFTGIPYAHAPRFQLPKPVEPWKDIYDATAPGPACPQPKDLVSEKFLGKLLMAGIRTDEDCLSLSVTTPAGSTSVEPLKVMAWIHGGGFVTGACDLAIYDPSTLVREQRVIVVNINYRLGLFGYLGDGSSRPGNLGLFDLLQALRWIQCNISAFGGDSDPKSITLFGQSAGGTAAADLMLTKDAILLFGRVIIESAPFGLRIGRDDMNKELLDQTKDLTIASPGSEVIAKGKRLRDMGFQWLGFKWGWKGLMVFAPQYGQEPLPAEKDVDTIRSGSASKFDVLLGSAAQEATLFIELLPALNALWAVPRLGLYLYRALSSWATRKMYRDGAEEFVSLHAKAGGKVSLYEISWSPRGRRRGAPHGVEIPLLFGDKEAWSDAGLVEGFTWEEQDQAGSKLRAIWASFAKGRQPSEDDSVEGVISIIT
jgi:para-nitrobenzyl esterase